MWPLAVTTTRRRVPAACMAVMIARAPSVQTEVSVRLRGPSVETTASRPATASRIAAGSMASAVTVHRSG